MTKNASVEVTVYDDDDVDAKVLVMSHWNRHETLVVLSVDDKEYVVSAHDLTRAVRAVTL